MSRQQVYQKLAQAGDQQAKKREQGGFSKGIVPAAYVSGNPTLQLPAESASTVGTKTHRVFQPYSNRTLPPAASQSTAILYDGDRNRIAGGAIVDLSSYVLDSDYLMGLRPVTPGNTTLASANTERSTTSATFVQLKAFFATRPGKYRVTFRLSRTGGTTQAKVRLLYPDGSFVDASATQSYNSTVYPTFGSFTADMTVEAWWGAQISVWVLNDSGPAQTGYIDTCVLKYADATATLSPHSAVITD